jgi:hypothetical protein
MLTISFFFPFSFSIITGKAMSKAGGQALRTVVTQLAKNNGLTNYGDGRAFVDNVRMKIIAFIGLFSSSGNQ